MQYENLKRPYGKFKEEVNEISPSYHPCSINIDGYQSIKKAVVY
ncbi:MAG: hypothetical protein AB8G86_12630 [Saprospiraceae bacterium]